MGRGRQKEHVWSPYHLYLQLLLKPEICKLPGSWKLLESYRGARALVFMVEIAPSYLG